MRSKLGFSRFWHHQPDSASNKKIPMPKSESSEVHARSQAQGGGLLSCEDIYRASGFLAGHSKYDILKIVAMINSSHIRELPKDVKRASVLMALDAAGVTADEVLQDAERRQHALNTYESGRQNQLEESEAAKITENTTIKAEMERIAAHYAERIQHNLDLISREKEAFHAWQKKKQEESQRISDAVALCGTHPLPENSAAPREAQPALPTAQAVAAGTV